MDAPHDGIVAAPPAPSLARDARNNPSAGAARRSLERFGVRATVMLGQDFTGLSGLVGDGALAYFAAQYRELRHGNGVAGLTHLAVYDARSGRVHHPATPLNTSSRPLSRTGGERRTTREVIIYHAGSLQEAVRDRRSDEGEATPLQVLAEPVGQLSPAGQFGHAAGAVDQRRAVHPGPQVAGERPVLLLGGQEGPGVADRARHLEPVAHDARVGQQLRQLRIVVTGDELRVEAVQRAPVV